MSHSNILIHLSGSIAAFKASTLASLLIKEGYAVQFTATSSALNFLGESTMEGITDRRVLTDMFKSGDAKIHIDLARWADLMVVYPASANSIGRLAGGLADDLLTASFLANDFNKPFWIAPAMNVNMYNHPAVQENLEKLERWGCRILPTEEGRLACGDVGKGRLISPEYVFGEIQSL